MESIDAIEEPNPSKLNLPAAAFVAVLAAVTVWAYAGDPNAQEVAEPGVRVAPSAAYNPVTAGEPLPDGFRQLLPRDVINPVYEPEFVEPELAGWADEIEVIGVFFGDEAKAYPVSFMTRREIVVDELDGIPILVTW